MGVAGGTFVWGASRAGETAVVAFVTELDELVVVALLTEAGVGGLDPEFCEVAADAVGGGCEALLAGVVAGLAFCGFGVVVEVLVHAEAFVGEGGAVGDEAEVERLAGEAVGFVVAWGYKGVC